MNGNCIWDCTNLGHFSFAGPAELVFCFVLFWHRKEKERERERESSVNKVRTQRWGNGAPVFKFWGVLVVIKYVQREEKGTHQLYTIMVARSTTIHSAMSNFGVLSRAINHSIREASVSWIVQNDHGVKQRTHCFVCVFQTKRTKQKGRKSNLARKSWKQFLANDLHMLHFGIPIRVPTNEIDRELENQ